MEESLRRGAVAGALVAVAGVLAWVSGFPFIFPSLGPTAYLLAVRPTAATARPRRVVGGHVVGVVAGLVAFHLFAPELAVTGTLAPLSTAGLRLVASGILATALTAGGMLATDLRHAPACATTLIVALGLLPTLAEAAGIIGAVVVLVGVHVAGRAVGRTLVAVPQRA